MRFVLQMPLTLSDGSQIVLTRVVDLPGCPHPGDRLSGGGFTDSVVVSARWNWETGEGTIELAERTALLSKDEYTNRGWNVEPK